jgi:hypothetical protein
VPVDGETTAAFQRCAAEVNAAIRKSPAHWNYWPSPVDLANLGLISPDRSTAPRPLMGASVR